MDGVDVASVGAEDAARSRGHRAASSYAIVCRDDPLQPRHVWGRTDEELEAALELARGGGLAASGSARLADVPGFIVRRGHRSCWRRRPANRVASLALDFELSEFGANLSVGERQLLCLARAIARKSRLVLMDEATANVDQKTDRLVQRVLNGGALGGATRITIAQRLGTIAACDAVAVLDDGKLLEYAAPSSLLADADSGFAAADAAGSLARSSRPRGARTSAARTAIAPPRRDLVWRARQLTFTPPAASFGAFSTGLMVRRGRPGPRRAGLFGTLASSSCNCTPGPTCNFTATSSSSTLLVRRRRSRAGQPGPTGGAPERRGPAPRNNRGQRRGRRGDGRGRVERICRLLVGDAHARAPRRRRTAPRARWRGPRRRRGRDP